MKSAFRKSPACVRKMEQKRGFYHIYRPYIERGEEKCSQTDELKIMGRGKILKPGKVHEISVLH